jgi:putative oxidoreductase
MILSFEQLLTRYVPDWLVGLALRFGLATPFWKSGLTKWDGFGKLSESAPVLFEHEFKLHVLGRVYDYPYPTLMAYGSGVAEIALPLLLVAGLFSRFAAFGLLVMTAIIQLTIPSGWPLHLTWAALALGILVLGPGRLSLDGLLKRI